MVSWVTRVTRRDQKFGVNRDHARSKPGARQRDASPRPAPSKPYWLPRSDEVQERAAAGRKPAVGEFLDPGGGPGGHERTAVSAPRAKKGGMATYQVDGGGAIGFRNSPNPKDMANVAKAPPAPPLSKWVATAEKEGWIQTKVEGQTLWLPTQYMDKLKLEAKPPPTAAGGSEAAAAKSYTCLKKCQVRAGFAADSDKAMILTPGTVIEVLAARPNESGVLRIQFSGGWVNERTGAGVVCLELASLPKPTDGQPAGLIPSPSAAEPVPEPSPVRAAKKKPYVKGKVVLVDYTTPDLVRSSRMCVSRMCTSNVRHSNRSMLMPPWGRCRWIWLGNDSWSQVFVTLDCYGNLCTFHDEDSTNPAALVRPEEARPEDAPQALIKHPHSFVVKGSVVGERLKTPAPTKIVLEPTEAQPGNQTSPTESVEQEAQVEELIPTPFRLSHAA